MWNASHHDSCRHCRRMASLLLLTGVICLSFPAAAQVYPVNGVFSAIDMDYPDRNGACMALKTFGMEAISKRAIPQLIIFSKDRRYDVKGDSQSEEKIKSIKRTKGGFRITELSASRPRLFGFRRKMTYLLKIVDPMTIEIWDGTTVSQYAKCESRRPPVS
jgi:hypothetical protein